jgi:hypothetical protein
MDSQGSRQGEKVVNYILYDKVTGAVIGRHRVFDVQANKYVEADEAQTLALFTNDMHTLERVSDHSPANLAVMKAALSSSRDARHAQVVKNRLVEQPRLVMFSDKDELEGDGKDQATLTIMLQNDKGKVITQSDAAVLVTTTRGKLSARGGLITLEHGRITLTLTSVAETVQTVRVRCELQAGGAEPTEIRLAFL